MTKQFSLIFCFLVFSYSCKKKSNYNPHKLSSVPYSESVQVGDMLYISEQIGNTEDNYSEVVPGGIKPQVHQVMKNIKKILSKHNAGMEDLVKCTCILVNADDWGEMSEIYIQYFNHNKPARTTIGGAELPMGALVEIDCIARLNN